MLVDFPWPERAEELDNLPDRPLVPHIALPLELPAVLQFSGIEDQSVAFASRPLLERDRSMPAEPPASRSG